VKNTTKHFLTNSIALKSDVFRSVLRRFIVLLFTDLV